VEEFKDTMTSIRAKKTSKKENTTPNPSYFQPIWDKSKVVGGHSQ
jgi:hypothetical protein